MKHESKDQQRQNSVLTFLTEEAAEISVGINIEKKKDSS
jgi:hypothetical protein